MTATFDQLADTENAVLACLLNAPAKDITAADKQLPPFRDPVLQWARQALAAAVDQDAPLWPVSIVAAANRAGLTTPPGLRQMPASWLSEMMSTAPPPVMLWGLAAELEQAAIRNAIAAYGQSLADNAHKGDLDQQAIALRQSLALALRIQELGS
jgi:hypothetical protein